MGVPSGGANNTYSIAVGDINGDGLEDTVVLIPSMHAFSFMLTPIPFSLSHGTNDIPAILLAAGATALSGLLMVVLTPQAAGQIAGIPLNVQPGFIQGEAFGQVYRPRAIQPS